MARAAANEAATVFGTLVCLLEEYLSAENFKVAVSSAQHFHDAVEELVNRSENEYTAVLLYLLSRSVSSACLP